MPETEAAPMVSGYDGGLMDGLRALVNGWLALSFQDILYAIGMALAIFLPLMLMLWVVQRRQTARQFESPQGLFDQIARAQGLSRRKRHALFRLAIKTFVGQPARLYLDPDVIDTTQWAEEMALSSEDASDQRRLLYGDELADPHHVRQRETPAAAVPYEQLPKASDIDALPECSPSLHSITSKLSFG